MNETTTNEETDCGVRGVDEAVLDVLVNRDHLEAAMITIEERDTTSPFDIDGNQAMLDMEGKQLIKLKSALEAEGEMGQVTMKEAETTTPIASTPTLEVMSTDAGPLTLEGEQPKPTVLLRSTDMRQQHHSEPGAYSYIGEPLNQNENPDFSFRDSNESTSFGHASEHPEVLYPPTNSISNSCLVEAKVVTEESTMDILQEAQHVDLSMVAAEQERIKSMEEMAIKKRQRIGMVLVACFLCILAVGVGVAVGIGNDTSPQNESPSVFPSTVPSGIPSAAPTQSLDLLFTELPESTQYNIKKGSTPQYQAWEWLSYHQNITNLPEWRKTQLFALASFFYAFEGENWDRLVQERWLDDALDECLWFSTGFGRFVDGEYIAWPDYLLGAIPPCDHLGRFTSLELQNLELYGFAPSIPPEITLLTLLTTIGLYQNGEFDMPLTAFIPSELYEMTSLINLWLFGNSFKGHIPSELGSFTMLTELELDQNKFSGSLPSELGRMTKLEHLHLYKNALSGSLPSELGLMTVLTELKLLENLFSGSLPMELGMMTGMSYLWLGNNLLSGTVPTAINCTNITLLDLQSNTFSGTIPNEVWQLSRLFWLDLSDLPQLTGPINLSFLSDLGFFDISGSVGLSGTLPAEACSLQNLSCTYVDLKSQEVNNCSLNFNCTELLCGCSCPCPTA